MYRYYNKLVPKRIWYRTENFDLDINELNLYPVIVPPAGSSCPNYEKNKEL